MGHPAGGELVPAGRVGALALRSLDDMLKFAAQVVAGKLAPSGDTVATVAVKLQAGAELGFSPVQSLSVLTVINGRIGIMGVGALARLRASGALATPIGMGVDGQGEDRAGWILTRRRGEVESMRSEFSVRDAKRAGLWGKAGPWTQYPDDMLQWRAVGRHVKRHWSDVLLGVDIAETIDVHPVGRASVVPQATGPDPLLIEANAGGAAGDSPDSQQDVTGGSVPLAPVNAGERPAPPTSDGEMFGTIQTVTKTGDLFTIGLLQADGEMAEFATKNAETADLARSLIGDKDGSVVYRVLKNGKMGAVDARRMPF